MHQSTCPFFPFWPFFASVHFHDNTDTSDGNWGSVLDFFFPPSASRARTNLGSTRWPYSRASRHLFSRCAGYRLSRSFLHLHKPEQTENKMLCSTFLKLTHEHQRAVSAALFDWKLRCSTLIIKTVLCKRRTTRKWDLYAVKLSVEKGTVLQIKCVFYYLRRNNLEDLLV